MKLSQEELDKIGELPIETRVKVAAELINLANQIEDVKRIIEMARAQSMHQRPRPKPEREPGIITEFFRLLF